MTKSCILSDLLGELAALNQYQPTASKRSRVVPPGERAPLVQRQPVQQQPVQQQPVQQQYIAPPPFINPIPLHNSSAAPNPSIPLNINNDMLLDTRPSVPPMNWDLSNLLLIEMGITPSYYPPHVDGAQQPMTYVDGHVANNNHNHDRSLLAPSSEEVFALWHDMPAVFQR